MVLCIKQSVRGKGNIKACRGHRVKMALDLEGTENALRVYEVALLSGVTQLKRSKITARALRRGWK